MNASKRAPAHAPLVLVHGNPENAAVWGPLLAELDRDDAICLSPPGFGVPVPTGFQATVSGYGRWLEERLEDFEQPVDLVGHDWGGAHVVGVAMSRPDLIRSWVSDTLGTFHPDYVWHPLAQLWQQEGPGEESVAQLFGGDLQQRLAVVGGLGMTGPTAERVAASLDADMGNAVLRLLRSARQPAMAQAGRNLPAARQRPGLALIPTADDESNMTVEMHQWAAEQAGAQVALLEGVRHWWRYRTHDQPQQPSPGSGRLSHPPTPRANPNDGTSRSSFLSETVAAPPAAAGTTRFRYQLTVGYRHRMPLGSAPVMAPVLPGAVGCRSAIAGRCGSGRAVRRGDCPKPHRPAATMAPPECCWKPSHVQAALSVYAGQLVRRFGSTRAPAANRAPVPRAPRLRQRK